MSRLLLMGLAGSLYAAGAAAQGFPTNQCGSNPAPPAYTGKKDPVEHCGLAGSAPEPEHKAQNERKNNLCAANGRAPTLLTKRDFIELQRAADRLVQQGRLQYGERGKLPKDRSVLASFTLPSGKRVGEGSFVSFIGFISHPRNSNVENGESVNCNMPGADANDIHFDVVTSPGDEACTSITGEIIPHRRAPAYQVPVLRLTRVAERPIRMSGQLFFDGSHLPCRPNSNNNKLPLRATVWEIHPVYQIEVCRKTTLAACKPTDPSLWIPLEKFVNTAHEDDE